MEPEIHIGKIIRAKLKEEGRSIFWLAHKFGCDPSNIHKIFKKEHLHPLLLWRISKILNYNFFTHYHDSFAQYQKSVAEMAMDMWTNRK